MRKMMMFVLLMMVVSGAQAQTESVGKWSVTPFVGINSSNMSGQDLYVDFNRLVKPRRQIGFVVGAEVEYRYMQPLSTALGVWYSGEGFRYTEIEGDTHTNLDFLNFSAVENFYVADGLAIKAGLQLGYMFNVKSVVDGHSEDIDNSFKKLNVSIPIGLSYEYRNVVFDLRYNIGLANLCDLSLLDEKWRTNSLWLTAGYRFCL
jgi:hypothetical protein